jgi:hypothetical protein
VIVRIPGDEEGMSDLKIDYLVYDIREIIDTFAKVEFTDNVKHFEWFYDPMKGKVVFKFYYKEKGNAPNIDSDQ